MDNLNAPQNQHMIILAIGHGIGIPLAIYLNLHYTKYFCGLGSLINTVLMILGAILVGIGQTYRMYRKYRRNKRKRLLALKALGRNDDLESHKKDCPKRDSCMGEAAYKEKSTNTVVNTTKSTKTASTSIDDLNISEDSSNSEDQEDDEGMSLRFSSYLSLKLYYYSIY